MLSTTIVKKYLNTDQQKDLLENIDLDILIEILNERLTHLELYMMLVKKVSFSHIKLLRNYSNIFFDIDYNTGQHNIIFTNDEIPNMEQFIGVSIKNRIKFNEDGRSEVFRKCKIFFSDVCDQDIDFRFLIYVGGKFNDMI